MKTICTIWGGVAVAALLLTACVDRPVPPPEMEAPPDAAVAVDLLPACAPRGPAGDLPCCLGLIQTGTSCCKGIGDGILICKAPMQWGVCEYDEECISGVCGDRSPEGNLGVCLPPSAAPYDMARPPDFARPPDMTYRDLTMVPDLMFAKYMECLGKPCADGCKHNADLEKKITSCVNGYLCTPDVGDPCTDIRQCCAMDCQQGACCLGPGGGYECLQHSHCCPHWVSPERPAESGFCEPIYSPNLGRMFGFCCPGIVVNGECCIPSGINCRDTYCGPFANNPCPPPN